MELHPVASGEPSTVTFQKPPASWEEIAALKSRSVSWAKTPSCWDCKLGVSKHIVMVPLRATCVHFTPSYQRDFGEVWLKNATTCSLVCRDFQEHRCVYTVRKINSRCVLRNIDFGQIACWDGHGACTGCTACAGSACSAGSAGGGACTGCTGCACSAGSDATIHTVPPGSAGGTVWMVARPTVATPPAWPAWMLCCYAKAAKARLLVLWVAQFRAQLNKDLLLIQTLRIFRITSWFLCLCRQQKQYGQKEETWVIMTTFSVFGEHSKAVSVSSSQLKPKLLQVMLQVVQVVLQSVESLCIQNSDALQLWTQSGTSEKWMSLCTKSQDPQMSNIKSQIDLPSFNNTPWSFLSDMSTSCRHVQDMKSCECQEIPSMFPILRFSL